MNSIFPLNVEDRFFFFFAPTKKQDNQESIDCYKDNSFIIDINVIPPSKKKCSKSKNGLILRKQERVFWLVSEFKAQKMIVQTFDKRSICMHDNWV